MKFTPLPPALMRVEPGEEIAGAGVTPHNSTGEDAKLIAKRKRDGSVAGVHFVQRDDGRKEMYRGDVNDVARLAQVVTALNNALRTAYGPACEQPRRSGHLPARRHAAADRHRAVLVADHRERERNPASMKRRASSKVSGASSPAISISKGPA